MHFHPEFEFRMMYIHLHIRILKNVSCDRTVDAVRVHRKGLVMTPGDHLECMFSGVLRNRKAPFLDRIQTGIHPLRKGKGRNTEHLLQFFLYRFRICAVKADIKPIITAAVLELCKLPENPADIVIKFPDKILPVLSFRCQFSVSDQYGIVISHIVLSSPLLPVQMHQSLLPYSPWRVRHGSNRMPAVRNNPSQAVHSSGCWNVLRRYCGH